jgi:hypothetical protein
LTAIPEVGFVDFKEQAISLIARSHRVRVVEASERSALPVRSLPEYISALRHHHGLGRSSASHGFSIVEAGARVDQSSRIHDSVVLCGGRVEARAIVAGSLVTANGMIGAGERVAGHLVTGRIGLASGR